MKMHDLVHADGFPYLLQSSLRMSYIADGNGWNQRLRLVRSKRSPICPKAASNRVMVQVGA